MRRGELLICTVSPIKGNWTNSRTTELSFEVISLITLCLNDCFIDKNSQPLIQWASKVKRKKMFQKILMDQFQRAYLYVLQVLTFTIRRESMYTSGRKLQGPF